MVDAVRGASRGRSLLCATLSLLLALPACSAHKNAKYGHGRDPDTTRYRLLLRENPIDPGQALHCYADCQPQASPRGYLQCLMACPGFEVTAHEYCAPDEVPPVAACFTARKIPAKAEPPPGLVVLEAVGTFLVVIAAESLCALVGLAMWLQQFFATSLTAGAEHTWAGLIRAKLVPVPGLR